MKEMSNVAIVTVTETMHWLNSTDFAAPLLIWLLTLLNINLPTAGVNVKSPSWHHSLRDQLAIFWQLWTPTITEEVLCPSRMMHILNAFCLPAPRSLFV